MMVTHTFAPVCHPDARVLILGTMPSPKSREQGFYYGHPRNRFWRILSDICKEPLPESVEEKIALCRHHRLAVWDVLACCEIEGADDNSIRNPIANDMSLVMNQAPIQVIFTTGTKADNLYKKFCYPQTGIASIKLPSTSPANCVMPYEKLLEAYRQILSF